MARYRPDEFHQSMLIPVSLEEQLMPGTLEYAIHTLIDQEVDTGGLAASTATTTRAVRPTPLGCC